MKGTLLKPWIEVSLTVPTPLREEVSALIFEETGQGSFFHEETIEADRSRTVILTYLPRNEHLRDQLRRLKKRIEAFYLHFPETEPPTWTFRHLFEENWQENWKRHFQPLRLGTGLVVCPTWETYAPGPGETVIRLDPGQAFGTGGHASTRLCLKAMDTLRKDSTSPDFLFSRVLDIGTGTGILALAAAAYGAGSVLAVDNDPLAVEAAVRHVRLNGMEDTIRVEPTAAEDLRGEFTLVLANLTLKDLLSLVTVLHKLLVPGGRLVTSGVLDTQAKTLIHAYLRQGFLFDSLLLEEEWASVLFRSGTKGE